MLTTIVLSLISMLLFGISNGLQKIPTARIGAVQFIVYRGLVISSITFVLACLNFDAGLFDWGILLQGILLAMLSYLGIYFFSMGLFESKAGIVIPIVSARVIIITIVGILFLGEALNWGKLFFVIPIILGIVLVSFNLQAWKSDGLKKGVTYALLAAFFWGITLPFFGVYSNKLGVYTYAFVLEFTVFMVSLIQNVLLKRNTKIFLTKTELRLNWKIILLVASTGAFASIASNAAYATGFVGIVAAISSVSPLISVAIGRIFLHEKMTMQQYIGAGVIFVGIIGISIVGAN